MNMLVLAPILTSAFAALTGLWALTPVALVLVFFVVSRMKAVHFHQSLAVFILGFITALPFCIWLASRQELPYDEFRMAMPLYIIGYAGIYMSIVEIVLGIFARCIWPDQYTEYYWELAPAKKKEDDAVCLKDGHAPYFKLMN